MSRSIKPDVSTGWSTLILISHPCRTGLPRAADTLPATWLLTSITSPRERGVQVAHRLDALDLAEALAGRERVPDGGQLDHDQVGQLIDRELADSDRRDIALEMNPLVRGSELSVLRSMRHGPRRVLSFRLNRYSK